MKKKLLYCLTALLALGFSSCKDDDEVLGAVNPADEYDRMPMTMFRLEENTNVKDDPYGMRVITEELNTVELAWFGVAGAGGYEIKFGLGPGLTSGKEEDWNNTDRLYQWEDGKYSKIVPPDQLTLRIQHLDYGTNYRFAIRVLHPDYMDDLNSTKHSRWFGYGDGRQWADQAGLTTEPRYTTPGVLNISNISENRDAFTIYISRNVKDAVDSYCTFHKIDTKKDSEELIAWKNQANEVMRDSVYQVFKEHFEMIDPSLPYNKAQFKIDKLKVLPSSETPNATLDSKYMDYTLQEEDFVDGRAEIRVGGLTQNAIYLADVFNTNITVDVDSRYNTARKAVYGEPGEAIIIEHKVREFDSIPGEVKYQACSLDEIIGGFGSNISLAEGQTFYLRGDKAYYLSSNPIISKGFILETHPDDVALGKRAKVYMGGIGVGLDADGNKTATIATCNFMFGKQKAAGEADCPIEVGEVIFRNIDFDCPEAKNYGHQQEKIENASGNYFANMYADGMAVEFKSFEVYNCSFQRMVRGFFRVQGSKNKFFEKLYIDGCMFYNCGYFDNKGAGYAWIAGDGALTTSNIYNDFRWTNNTIYDSPRAALVIDGNKDINYEDNVKWNITIEDNTFVNYATRANTNPILNIRYVPGGSDISVQRNLFVLAADDNDKRDLRFYGADVRTIKGSGEMTFTIKDNYSLGCRDAHMTDDGIFTSNKFSADKNSFGSKTMEDFNLATKQDLVVKVVKEGDKALKATDVFTAPNPPYTGHIPGTPNHRDHEAPADIFNALKYKTVPAVLQNVGDKRWMSADPKHYYDNL